MKTTKQIQESTNSIINSINEAIKKGQTIGVFRWLSKDSHGNDIQKESRHNLKDINRKNIENYVTYFDDYHMI